MTGIAASWAKAVLETNDLPPRLRGANLKTEGPSEKEIYGAEVKDCTHFVSDIGYEINPSLRIHVDGNEVEPAFDPLIGKSFRAKGRSRVFGRAVRFWHRVSGARD